MTPYRHPITLGLRWLGACRHPTVVGLPMLEVVEWRRWRFCLLCGNGYDRTEVLLRLREAIRQRHRISHKRLVFT